MGMVWMYGEQFSLGAGAQMVGTLVALLVPLAGAINWTVVQRSQLHGERIDLVPAVLMGAVISTLLTLPLAFPFSASGHDIALLAVLGLMQLAIPCVLSVRCAGVLKAPEIALLALLEVIFGIMLAWVGAGEVPAPSVWQGGALVLGALVMNELWAWRQSA
jgi:drug/metabolite transporter (DMT)-like permease